MRENLANCRKGRARFSDPTVRPRKNDTEEDDDDDDDDDTRPGSEEEEDDEDGYSE